MRPESLAFFKEIVNTPSPSGYEERAAEVYRNYTKSFADEVRTDVHGNVYAILNPNAKMKVMLAGRTTTPAPIVGLKFGPAAVSSKVTASPR